MRITHKAPVFKSLLNNLSNLAQLKGMEYFILLMIGTVTYDGLRETTFWFNLFGTRSYETSFSTIAFLSMNLNVIIFYRFACYFAIRVSGENYDLNEEYRNPLFDTEDDDEKESRIDTVLASRGLPDVTDFYDLASVANKALLDTRIDTKGFDGFSNEKIIETCVTQLGLDEYGDIFVKSERLLNNLNRRDRDIIKEQLDQNRDANTIS